MQKIAIILSVLMLASCTSAPQPTVSEPVQEEASPIKTAEVTIVQDKTTKIELISALGAPTLLNNASMTWMASVNDLEYFDVKYIQRDGTTFDFCVGMRDICKKYISVIYKIDGRGNSLDVVKNMNY